MTLGADGAVSRTTNRGTAGTVELTEQRREHYRLHADVCRVLTDPKRLMLLDALRAGERSVGDLALAIGVALPNASQHLAVLRNSGLVLTRRDGNAIFYRLADPRVLEACRLLQSLAG